MRSETNQTELTEKCLTTAGLIAKLAKLSRALFFFVALALFPALASAATVVFNSTGGVDSKGADGPMFTLDTQSSKLQVKWKGINRFQDSTNGVYVSAPTSKPGSSAMYGNLPPGQAFATANTTPASLPPAVNGVAQSAEQTFTTTEGLALKINWKYTRPNNYITADVELTIPDSYTIYDVWTNPTSHTPGNPGDNVWQGFGALNYSHTLNFVDYGCYASFTDNAKPHVGFYKNVSGAACANTWSMPGAGSEIIALRHNRGSPIPQRSVITFNEHVFPNFQINETLTSGVSGTTENRSIAAFTHVITSTGKKKFSYDIVLSTSQIIDHLELRHKGEASEYCGLDVTVLACQTSTVPCPEADLYTDQVVTGTLASNVTSPSFSLAPGGKSVNRIWKNQSDSPQPITATVTSTLKPKNPTKCWNTVTQSPSCDVLFTSEPCASFECMVSGQQAYANLQTTLNARNPLYTQLVGETFSVDIVALNLDGSVKEDYVTPLDTGTDTVLFFSDTRLPTNKICPTKAQTAIQTIKAPATSSLNFIAADKGRKTVSGITISQPYGKVSCQVISTNTALVDAWNSPLPPKTFCSSDSFTVRPKQLTVRAWPEGYGSSNGSTDSTGYAAYNTDDPNPYSFIKAGRPFTLYAAGGALNVVGGSLQTPDGANYSGHPRVVSPKSIQWNDTNGTPPSGRPSTYGRAAPGVGTLNGFNKKWGATGAPASDAVPIPGNFQFESNPQQYNRPGFYPGIASGTFTYDEVGYFQFQPYAVVDDDFVEVSSDKTNKDCISGSILGDFSNTRDSTGRYGCSFGNPTLTDHFGRFSVNHFKTEVVQGCPTGDFTYHRQPFKVKVTALNFAGGVTENFAENFTTGHNNVPVSLSLALLPGAASDGGRVGLYPTKLTAMSFRKGVAETGKNRDGVTNNGFADVALAVASDANASSPWLGTNYNMTNPLNRVVRASLYPGMVGGEYMQYDLTSRPGNDVSADPPQVGSAEGVLKVRLGRTRMLPFVFGMPQTDMKLLFVTEYMKGGAWVTNTDDDCTGRTDLEVTGTLFENTTLSGKLPASPPSAPTITSNSNAVSVTIAPLTTPALSTSVLDSGTPGLSGAGVLTSVVAKRFKKTPSPAGSLTGDFNLWLKAPGKLGSVKVTGKVPDWLNPWPSNMGAPPWNTDPSTTAIFGIHATPWIYRREVY